MSTPDDTREVILEARELTREFDGVKALDKFSFKLHRGEVLGLLGANGAGKTTAMNCLLGLTLQTSGDIFAFGKELHKHRIAILQRANFSSAYTALPGNLLVGQNLSVFARIYGVPDRKKKIAELMDLLEIGHLAKRVTGQLSAGESTRVNLVKAFLNDPELLMLDEPTASLDPGQIHETREVIRLFGSERAVLLSTHILSEVTLLCSRVAIINQGRMLAVDTPDRLQQAAEESNVVWVEAAGDEAAIKQALQAVDGVVSVSSSTLPKAKLLSFDCMVSEDEGIQQRIARAVTSAGELQRLERRKPTLENVFLRYVAQSSKNPE